MSTYTREQIDKLVTQINKEDISQVYLFVGERYLCQQAADKIGNALITKGGKVHSIDGLQEDISITLGKITSFSLFPGRQVYRINDTKIFQSAKNAQSLWKKTVAAYKENNRPLASGYLKAMLDAVGLNADDPDNDPGSLTSARWKKLFGFAKPQENLDWTLELLDVAGSETAQRGKSSITDPEKVFENTLTKGLPKQNVLLLLTEDVDKRKRLFKFLTDQFVTIDLGVEGGSSSRAQKEQHAVLMEILLSKLSEYGKTCAQDAASMLFERVGFHPVAVAMETEKLALYAGTRTQITKEDIETLIGRTRQDALFELTDFLGKKNMEKALIIIERLQENGIHPLAIIATIRNYLHTLLLFRALQALPEIDYSSSISPGQFQQQCLPRLKQKTEWKQELSGHPYAVYMQFKTASSFSLSTLRKWMELVLQADFRLKGSPVAPDIVLQHLIIDMLGNADYTGLKKYRGGLH